MPDLRGTEIVVSESISDGTWCENTIFSWDFVEGRAE